MDTPVLDVRTLPHGSRHEVIFATFQTLKDDQSFTIINDHDPLPLRYQLVATYGPALGWAYEEEGPEQWRVRISRQAVS